MVNGELHVKRLVVELGAHFDGSCKMLTDKDLEAFANVSGNSSDVEAGTDKQ